MQLLVGVASPQTLAAVLEGLAGFAIATRVYPGGVDAELAEPANGAAPGSADQPPPMLMPRPRFRLARHGESATAGASLAPLDPDELTEVAATEHGAGELVAADARPGGAAPLREHLTLVVYPFHSFLSLNAFQHAVRALHGVAAIRIRRFYRGTLRLAIEYEDVLPFVERLNELDQFTLHVVAASADEVEAVLSDQS